MFSICITYPLSMFCRTDWHLAHLIVLVICVWYGSLLGFTVGGFRDCGLIAPHAVSSNVHLWISCCIWYCSRSVAMSLSMFKYARSGMVICFALRNGDPCLV